MNSCSACISAAYDAMFEGKDSISCAEFIVGMCPAIATECDCGDCRQSLEDVSGLLKTYLELLFLCMYIAAF
jgi:hypothetical protein